MGVERQIPGKEIREEIKCPWDKDGNSHRVRTTTGHGDWWAFCECSVRGPVRATEEDAVAAWNQWTRSLVIVRPTTVADHAAEVEKQWVSVEERLPRVGEACWIVYSGVVQTIAYRLVGRGFACEDGYEWMTMPDIEADPLPTSEDVTHWMPMPKPPVCTDQQLQPTQGEQV